MTDPFEFDLKQFAAELLSDLREQYNAAINIHRVDEIGGGFFVVDDPVVHIYLDEPGDPPPGGIVVTVRKWREPEGR